MTSFVANSICGLLLGTGLHEHTTSFRVYSTACARLVVDNFCQDGYEWLIGAVLTARRNGLRIKEVPIVFNNRINGKSKLKVLDIVAWFAAFGEMMVTKRVIAKRWSLFG
jgi:dolichol-phosphate mannosyltransferase